VSREESLVIGDKSVGPGSPCFIIAEAGVAHFGDLDKAKQLVDLAANSGADAVKFQTFDVDALISRESSHWKKRLASRGLTSEQFVELKSYCDQRQILFLSTAHDEIGLQIVETLDPPAFKIGSGERGNWLFVEKIARIGKPLIISTGMYSEEDVREVLDIIDRTGNRQVALLHCVTSYPTSPQNANLRTIQLYKEIFGGVVGYSDHTQGSTAVLGAIALGADIVEKHIALDFDVPNAQDWKVSAGPKTFPRLVEKIKKLEACLRQVPEKKITSEELASQEWACKSLATRCEVKRGQIVDADMLVSKRPGTGISPRYLTQVVGRRVNTNLSSDSIVRWEYLE
jgi:N,N'-diacetyllegionaminate synthase